MNSYKVNSVNTKNKPDFDNLPWEKAVVLTDFVSPWNEVLVDKIEFSALHDEINLYFKFKVHDSEVHVVSEDNSNDSINNSDRVELFFRSNAEMKPYYCLEIDPTPRVMDFKAMPNKEFDFGWTWPKEEFTVVSSKGADFFIVQGAISIESLKELDLLKNNKIETGIYRAKYNKMANDSYEPTWITWIDPKTEEPNFHIKSSFGILELL